MARLEKPTRDNLLGLLIGALGVLGSAHSHHWSLQAMWANAWEALVLPWGLGLCFLFAIHVWQSARLVYKEESISFENALGGITKQPPWQYRWRHKLVLLMGLSVPMLGAYFIWVKTNSEPQGHHGRLAWG